MVSEETKRYVVCGCTPWARRVFDETLSKLPGEWTYADTPIALKLALTRPPDTATVFFLHWRWLVDAVIVTTVPCIGFHLGALPEERGGTPLQWRILSGQQNTVLTMFRMNEELDSGPVLVAVPIPLHGSAEAIYGLAMDRAADLIRAHLTEPWPEMPQLGERPSPLRRLAPQDSRIPSDVLMRDRPLHNAYDRIRMVDAPGYPLAFLDYGNLRFTFRRAVLYDGRIEADVTITERSE